MECEKNCMNCKFCYSPEEYEIYLKKNQMSNSNLSETYYCMKFSYIGDALEESMLRIADECDEFEEKVKKN